MHSTNIMTGFRWICLLWASSLLIACGAQDKTLSALPAGSTVLILGDSLSYGTGAKAGEEDYPTLLAKRTGWQIINAGVPGDTTAQGLARLPSLLATHQPAVLLVVLGGNDFLKKRSEHETIANLKNIIAQAKVNKIIPILVAIPDFQPVKAAFGGLEDHTLYAALADELQVPLIANVFSDVLSDYRLKADLIHPNAVGYQVVAEEMRQSLMNIGLLKE